MKFNEIVLPSDKKIGYFFSIISIILSLYFFLNSSLIASLSLLFLSSLLAFLSLYNSRLLRPLNILWMYIGYVLGKIVSPIVLGVLFFFIFTPVSLLQKLIMRDELQLNYSQFNSSWKIKNLTEPKSSSFKDQF